MSPTKHITISPTSATSVVLSSDAGDMDVMKDPSIIPLVEPEFSMFGTENGM